MGHTFANCLFKTYEFPIPIMSLRKCLLTSTRALLSLTLLVITSVLLNCWSSFLLSFNYITLDEELIKKIPDSLAVGVSGILPAVLIWFMFWVLTKRSDFLQSSCSVENRSCAAVAESFFLQGLYWTEFLFQFSLQHHRSKKPCEKLFLFSF